MYNLPFTFEELQEAVADGRVIKRDHDTLPFSIYNYTNEVQYLNTWDDITTNCRGLIIADYGKPGYQEVVARPWKKFFNLGQVNLPIQTTDKVEVMDKADGSLGILYPNSFTHATFTDSTCLEKRRYGIATRGSFNSTQAWHATKVWQDNYAEYYDDAAEAEVLHDYTILFEIIYPKNRIVLSYGDMDDLMLLGAVETKTGYYIGPKAISNMIAWPGPVVDTYEFNTISDALGEMGRANKEGFVIRSHNFLVKIKEPDYLDLHRLVTNLTSKTVWDKLRAGMSRSQIISAFPDEFHDDVKALIDPLEEAYINRYSEIQMRFDELLHKFMSTIEEHMEFNRAGFAKHVAKEPDRAYYFNLLDGKTIGDMIWKELKPKEEVYEM